MLATTGLVKTGHRLVSWIFPFGKVDLIAG